MSKAEWRGKKNQIFSNSTLYLFILVKYSRLVVSTFPIGHGSLPGQSGEIWRRRKRGSARPFRVLHVAGTHSYLKARPLWWRIVSGSKEIRFGIRSSLPKCNQCRIIMITIIIIIIIIIIICVGHIIIIIRQSLSHQKHCSVLRSPSSFLAVINFPCHFCSSTTPSISSCFSKFS